MAGILAFASDERTSKYDQSMLYTYMKFSKNIFLKGLKCEHLAAATLHTKTNEPRAKTCFSSKTKLLNKIAIVMIP